MCDAVFKTEYADLQLLGKEGCGRVTDRMIDLYVLYRGRYTMMREGGKIFIPKTKGAFTKLRNAVVYGHIMRQYAIGVFAGDRASKFICFDVDHGGAQAVGQLMNAIERLGIPRDFIHISTSGGKGYHVEIFIDPFIYVDEALRFYWRVMEECGFSAREIEFRPTAKQSIKLPLSKHQTTGRICWFVDRDNYQPIESTEYLFEIKKLPAKRFPRIEDVPENYRVSVLLPDKVGSPSMEIIGDDMEYLPLMQHGERHDRMMGIAINQRSLGYGEDACRKTLETWYHVQDVDLINTPEAVVLKDIDGIVLWVYADKFKPPQVEHGIARIHSGDIRMLAEQQLRSRRLILFFVLCRCLSRENKMTLERIGGITDLSIITVHREIHALEEAGYIETYAGKRTCPNGRYLAQATRYRVNRRAPPDHDCSNVGLKELQEDFMKIYHRTIHHFYGDTEPDFMLPREKKAYKKHLEDMRR